MFRLNIVRYFSPLNVATDERINTANVVVLIPPAVEPGDPPTYIRNMKKTIIEVGSNDRSTELKPAVRLTTDWKKAASILRPHESPWMASLWGAIRNTNIPARIRMPEVSNTTFEDVAMRRQGCFILKRILRGEKTSWMTRNPKPPKIISKAMMMCETQAFPMISPARLSVNKENPALLNAEIEWKIA